MRLLIESWSPRPALAVKDPWFYGYSTEPRWMELNRSGTAFRSVPTGIAVQLSVKPEALLLLQELCRQAGAAPCDGGWLLHVPQADQDGGLVDTVDRVQVEASSLQDLIAAGA